MCFRLDSLPALARPRPARHHRSVPDVSLEIREFRVGDEAALYEVFHSAVHDLAAGEYSPEQLAVWAPREPDLARWAEKMRSLRPFIAEAEAQAEAETEAAGRSVSIVGYADLQPDGYIDHFYVAGRFGRRGVGRLLMARILDRAADLRLPKLYAHVSHTARPFFAHFGFQVVAENVVTLAGVSLSNLHMEKTLPPRAEHGEPNRLR